MNQLFKTISLCVLFSSVLSFALIQPAAASEQSASEQSASKQSTSKTATNTESGTFTLNLWAPDQQAPDDATLVEVGDNYYYQYNPESISFSQEDSIKTLHFEFAPALADRYQFRWVTSSDPSAVTLSKIKDNKIQITVDAYTGTTPIYFEVWVLDTHTGQRFMCDPTIKVGGGTGSN
jgi:Tfp pilus assembly protein PilV